MKRYAHTSLSFKEAGEVLAAAGDKKAATKGRELFLLAMLAGFYVSLGGHFFLAALSEGSGKVVGGLVFSAGLILVVTTGAELFTGNMIMLIGPVTRRFPLSKMFRNWFFVYAGNFAGALVYVILVYRAGFFGIPGEGFSGIPEMNKAGELILKIAEKKLLLPFSAAFLRGILCNITVILAIILVSTTTDIMTKMLCCIVPISAFVAIGFEHCIANMFFIPLGLLIQGASFGEMNALWGNLLPVTLGNILGGFLIIFIHPARMKQLIRRLKIRS